MKPRSIALLTLLLSLAPAGAAPADDARSLIETSGIKGGLVVHLGSGDASLTVALRISDRYQVFGLDPDRATIDAARARLLDAKQYGPVTLDVLEGTALPLNDGLVNLLVADDLHGVPREEITRVLCPNGVAMIRGEDGAWERVLKPRPDTLDDWTHYFHDASGNAVSQDEAVGPPTRLQWVGSPRWSRHHDRMASMSALVSGDGRLFYIMDEGSRVSIQLPSKWNLIARDAYNGVVLWKKPIERWHDQLWPLKSGPSQLAKRLVTDGAHVYVPLGIQAPVSKLDAATGEILRTYEDTGVCEEMVLAHGILFVLVNRGDWELDDFAPKLNTGDQKRVETEFNWNNKPREIHAVNPETGETLWKKEATVSPLSLVADATRLAYHDGAALICLDPATGNLNWKNEEATRRSLFEFNYGPRIVLRDKVVLYAGGDGKLFGLDPADGKTLWRAANPSSGYRSPQDLLVANGLVWSAPTTGGGDSGIFTGRDPVTGEVKKEFPPTVDTYWFHHRCYIAKATEKYIMPSRTGIEFVDTETETWDINHWVRGGCLYGVLPANGLTYAPPHNCACYPEAKLSGFNALAAPGSKPTSIKEEARLEKGAAYDQPIEAPAANDKDWPTYRHDIARSGYTAQELDENLTQTWTTDIGGTLSAPTIADGKVFVSEIDAHTIHALDHMTGAKVWRFTSGGRTDSPPTYWKGRVLFGSSDGNVYCLRASDGALIWRYRAAPANRRTMVFEQLESLWPVPGALLVENGVISLVAGRSAFLDGGMHFLRLDAATGNKVLEKIIDDRDPETGGDLQDRIQTLQMPVALNDILSSDGKYTYLRSQKIDAAGERVEIGPISGNAAVQGAAQSGEGSHVFAPMGFLDDTWFHRAYWVYGRNSAGGHNGYYQAGKYAPSGRILVFDGENVYGYGRKPQYYKWTTTIEHQLFAASREIPDHSDQAAKEGGGGGKKKGRATEAPVAFDNSARLDPSGKALTVEAWVMLDQKGGVILAHGGPAQGYALTLQQGKPAFHVRAEGALSTATATLPLGGGWHHLAGVLGADGAMTLYVDGKTSATAKASGTIPSQPAQTLEIGADSGGSVAEDDAPKAFTGLIDQVAVYHRVLSGEEIAARFANPATKATDAVLACSFDTDDAKDESGGKNNGALTGAAFGKGVSGAALWVKRARRTPGGTAKPNLPANTAANGSFVEHQWAEDVPLYTRAMALAKDRLFIAGPPDTIDEEYTFERLAARDASVKAELAAQDEALDAVDKGLLRSVSTKDGATGDRIELECAPVWDGIAIAQGRLFVTGRDGSVRCFGGTAE